MSSSRDNSTVCPFPTSDSARRLLFGLLLAGIVVIACTTPLQAAEILKQDLVIDGSADPPGDKIYLRLAFDPGERTVRIEIKAYAARKKDEPLEGHEDLKPMKPASERYRGENGEHRIRVEIGQGSKSRTESVSIVDSSILIPFASIEPPTPGTYEIGYAIYGYVREGEGWRLAFPPALTSFNRKEISEGIVSRFAMVPFPLHQPRSLSGEVEAFFIDPSLDNQVPRKVTLLGAGRTAGAGRPPREVRVTVEGGILPSPPANGCGSGRPRSQV